MLKSLGPAGCHEVPGALPHRAGGGRHAVRGGEERKNLLPGFLQTLSQEIPRVRRGKLPADYVQGKAGLKYLWWDIKRKNYKIFPNFSEIIKSSVDQNICGTEPHPVKFRAKKYKIQEKSFGLSDFRQMMTHLPEHVPEAEISEMFEFADKDSDGRISYEEFLVCSGLLSSSPRWGLR